MKMRLLQNSVDPIHGIQIEQHDSECTCCTMEQYDNTFTSWIQLFRFHCISFEKPIMAKQTVPGFLYA